MPGFSSGQTLERDILTLVSTGPALLKVLLYKPIQESLVRDKLLTTSIKIKLALMRDRREPLPCMV